MAKNEGFVGDHLRLRRAPAAATFSQLLLAEDDDDDDENNNGVAVAVGLAVDQTTSFNYSSSLFSSEKPPKMLCFGNYHQKHHQGDQLVYPPITENNITNTNTTTPQKSGVTCSDSSSASSGNNNNNICVTLSVNTLSKPDVSESTWCNKKFMFLSLFIYFYMGFILLFDFCFFFLGRKSEMGWVRNRRSVVAPSPQLRWQLREPLKERKRRILHQLAMQRLDLDMPTISDFIFLSHTHNYNACL